MRIPFVSQGQDELVNFLKDLWVRLETVARNSARLFSTLDFLTVDQAKFSSGRDIYWCNLTPIDAELLSECQKAKQSPQWTPAWDVALSDCNGHARTIEVLLAKFDSWGDKAKKQSYVNIVAAIIADGLLKTAFLRATWDYARPALLNETCAASAVIGGKTFNELCELGVYTNSITDDKSWQIPVMTAFHLNKVAETYLNDKRTTLLKGMLRNEDPLASIRFENLSAYYWAL